MTKSIAKKSTTGSLPPAVPVAITPTFSPWTHTSDDSYIYQLSLVLATATVSFSDSRTPPEENHSLTAYKVNIFKLKILVVSLFFFDLGVKNTIIFRKFFLKSESRVQSEEKHELIIYKTKHKKTY